MTNGFPRAFLPDPYSHDEEEDMNGQDQCHDPHDATFKYFYANDQSWSYINTLTPLHASILPSRHDSMPSISSASSSFYNPEPSTPLQDFLPNLTFSASPQTPSSASSSTSQVYQHRITPLSNLRVQLNSSMGRGHDCGPQTVMPSSQALQETMIGMSDLPVKIENHGYQTQSFHQYFPPYDNMPTGSPLSLSQNWSATNAVANDEWPILPPRSGTSLIPAQASDTAIQSLGYLPTVSPEQLIRFEGMMVSPGDAMTAMRSDDEIDLLPEFTTPMVAQIPTPEFMTRCTQSALTARTVAGVRGAAQFTQGVIRSHALDMPRVEVRRARKSRQRRRCRFTPDDSFDHTSTGDDLNIAKSFTGHRGHHDKNSCRDPKCAKPFVRTEHAKRHFDSKHNLEKKRTKCDLEIGAPLFNGKCCCTANYKKTGRKNPGKSGTDKKEGIERDDNARDHFLTHLEEKRGPPRNAIVEADFLYFCIAVHDSVKAAVRIQKLINTPKDRNRKFASGAPHSRPFRYGAPNMEFQKRHPLYPAYLDRKKKGLPLYPSLAPKEKRSKIGTEDGNGEEDPFFRDFPQASDFELPDSKI